MAGVRQLAAPDEAALARLMLDAYRGTVDDQGETLPDAEAEVRGLFSGQYGEMNWNASFAVTDAGSANTDQALYAATAVTSTSRGPLLAFSLSAPDRQRRGLATSLIGHSARVLHEQGHGTLTLVVTAGNGPAEALYARLGFVEAASPAR